MGRGYRRWFESGENNGLLMQDTFFSRISLFSESYISLKSLFSRCDVS